MSDPFRRLGIGLLARIREVALAASPGPWSGGKSTDAVVAAASRRGGAPDEEELRYYGGALICESVGMSDRTFISVFNPQTALDLVEMVLRASEAEFTVDEARVVRTWRVDLGCTMARVAELVHEAWGYGDRHPDTGELYCAGAARLLGEDYQAPPWSESANV